MDIQVVLAMARRLQIVIEESVEFLEKQLKQTRTARQKERLQQVLENITPEQICSLSSYNFILEALFYAASY